MEGILLDPLQVKDSAGTTVNPSTEDTLNDILISIRRLIDATLLNPVRDMASNRDRVTSVLEAGTASVGTVILGAGTAAAGTVNATLGTTNIPQAQDVVLGANLTAWALCCRERIS